MQSVPRETLDKQLVVLSPQLSGLARDVHFSRPRKNVICARETERNLLSVQLRRIIMQRCPPRWLRWLVSHIIHAGMSRIRVETITDQTYIISHSNRVLLKTRRCNYAFI